MSEIWIFAYGSLMWRPGLDYIDRRPARVEGWSRRFWQGSHDHRGTPEAPGRVVTLVPEPGTSCDGVAYLIDPQRADQYFTELDHREKNGYQRRDLTVEFHAGGSCRGVVYIAPRGNFAYLGPASMQEIACQIQSSRGPSGHNVDYLLELAASLRQLRVEDEHVFELERLVC